MKPFNVANGKSARFFVVSYKVFLVSHPECTALMISWSCDLEIKGHSFSNILLLLERLLEWQPHIGFHKVTKYWTKSFGW